MCAHTALIKFRRHTETHHRSQAERNKVSYEKKTIKGLHNIYLYIRAVTEK